MGTSLFRQRKNKMREIKFRVWDNNQIKYDITGELLGHYQTLNAFFKKCRERQVPIMQYIGLKDKNGQEIYEGDIIEIKNKICYITYETCTASYHLVFKGGTSYQYERYKLDNSMSVLEFFEIIGNIYENPELLK